VDAEKTAQSEVCATSGVLAPRLNFTRKLTYQSVPANVTVRNATEARRRAESVPGKRLAGDLFLYFESHWLNEKLVADLNRNIVVARLDLRNLHDDLLFALFHHCGFVVVLVV
jgi:hypothetical protein